MNKLLEQEAANILIALQESMAKGTSFVTEQAPIIVQQLVAYNIWSHTWLMYIFAILSILCFIIMVAALLPEMHGDLPVWSFFMWLLFGGLSIYNWFSIHKLETAPNLWLMEYFSQIV